MKLSTSLVAVKKITSGRDRSAFPDEQINEIARLILRVEGVINPLILRRTGLDAYEVVDGDLEYYASVKAREIDPLKGEFLSAFILDSDNEESLKKQVQMLRSDVTFAAPQPVNPQPISQSNSSSTDFTVALKQIEGWMQRLENSLQIKFEQSLQAKFGDVLSRIDRLETTLSSSPAVAKSTKKPELTSYKSKTVAELKAIAKEQGLTVPSKIKKAELIALLDNKG